MFPNFTTLKVQSSQKNVKLQAAPGLTSVLGDILQVDEASEPLDGMPAAVPDELLTDEAGFCLPEIPRPHPTTWRG